LDRAGNLSTLCYIFLVAVWWIIRIPNFIYGIFLVLVTVDSKVEELHPIFLFL
jgi:hypothetical protein